MTDRKQALIALRDEVKAGVELSSSDVWDAFSRNERIAIHALNVMPAFHGSLDAAKALHEAVLPEWGWHVRQDEKDGFCHAHTLYPNYRVSPGGSSLDGNPARAWLIAILESLIAQEPSQ